MANSTHKCPVNKCGLEIRTTMLMCPTHLAMLAKPLRSEVGKWYRPGQEKTGGATPMYYEACRKAIASVNEKEAINGETARQQILL